MPRRQLQADVNRDVAGRLLTLMSFDDKRIVIDGNHSILLAASSRMQAEILRSLDPMEADCLRRACRGVRDAIAASLKSAALWPSPRTAIGRRKGPSSPRECTRIRKQTAMRRPPTAHLRRIPLRVDRRRQTRDKQNLFSCRTSRAPGRSIGSSWKRRRMIWKCGDA